MHQQEKTFEWHEAWKTLEKEWQIAATKGQQELLRIADIVQRTTYVIGDHWGSLSDRSILHQNATSKLWQKAHEYRLELEKVADELSTIFARMRSLWMNFYDTIEAQDLVPEVRTRHENFLFELVGMYEKELIAKLLIAQDIFETRKHETMTLYLASWQMQPFLNKIRVEEILSLCKFTDV